MRMRSISLFPALLLTLILFKSLAYAESGSVAQPKTLVVQSQVPAEAKKESPEDEELREILLQDYRICCAVDSIKPTGVDQLAGLLFWSRLRILCPGITPTAIC